MARELVRSYVDPDLLKEWNEKHGGYASISWLLETAMSQTLALTKDDPALGALVKAGIQQHIVKLREDRAAAQHLQDVNTQPE